MQRTSTFEIDFTGKTVVITGISSGIGAGIAKMYARAGANIAGCALEDGQDAKIVALKASLCSEYNNEILYVQADVTKPDQLKSFINKTVQHFSRIDIVASNAGTNVFAGAEQCSDEDWAFCMELNLKSHWNLAKLCKPHLEKSPAGVMVINSSAHSNSTIPGSFPYNIAKTGLKALIQSLTIEWGPSIRVVGVAPGFIDTPLAENWFNEFDNPALKRKETENAFPLKRLGTPEEIGGWFVFLSSDYASFTGGQTFLIDGGRSALMMEN